MNDPPPTIVPVELALTGVTVAACLGLSRLFATGSFLLPVLLAVVLAHGLAVLCRRREVGPLVTTLVVAAAAVLATTLSLYGFASWWGLPGADVVRVVGRDLRHAWSIFLDVKPPAPPERGFVLILVAVVWPLAVLADRAAFLSRSPSLALVPAGSLFVATSLFEGSRHRIVTTMVFGLAALTFVALHRIDLSGDAGSWLPHDHTRGAWALGQAGAGMAAAVILATALVGPRLPGVEGGSLVDWRTEGGGGDARVTVSPLVDIRTRLVELSGQEVFTVRSPVRAYWRLTALDAFDGQIWSSSGSYTEADGDVPGGTGTSASATDTETLQRFTITGLEALWLPAAFEARSINAPDEVRWDPESSTLVVDTDRATSDELSYDVTSAIPAFEPETLRATSDPPPAAVTDRYVDLPGNFSDGARAQAATIVAGSATDYDAALALQEFFRTNFRYSTEVPSGHTASDIDDFLDPDNGRAGYCEQFAGAYAAMARSTGLPSRVAVGFTPGDLDDEGLFHVRGEHAHAWPEVYFTGLGWVAFEPTPTRGAPGAEAYTGVTEQQATPIEGTSGPAPFPTVTAAAGSPGSTQPPGADAATAGSDTQGGSSSPAIVRWLARAGLVVAVLGTAYVVAVPLTNLGRRWMRRRRAARGPGPAIRGAWLDATRAWTSAGVTVSGSDTPIEVGERADVALGHRGDIGAELARLVSRITYGPADGDPPSAERARSLADDVVAEARGHSRWKDRARAWLIPRA